MYGWGEDERRQSEEYVSFDSFPLFVNDGKQVRS